MYHQDPYDDSIVIDGWEKGIADSPFQGIADMRNVNIISVPGEASVGFATTSITLPTASGSVTDSSASNDTLTLSVAVQEGSCLVFSGGSLPTGVTAGTKYIVGCVGGTPSTVVHVFTTYANYLTGPSTGYQNITTDGGTGTFVSVDMNVPTSRAILQSSQSVYIADKNGRVWGPNPFNTSYYVYLLGTDSTTTTNANGLGLCVYRGYLFSFRNALIDYMNLTSGAWTYAWQTMNTGGGVANSHYAYLATDDVVYYCDAAYIGSFFQKAGSTFDPSNSATYTWAQKALALPSDEIANCLAELGTNLLVGGQKNIIYPWNRIATSFTYPILLADSFIQRMQTVNTNTYILAGQRGRIYITNGSQANLYKKLPDHMSGTVEPFFQWGDLGYNRNQIYFGVQCKSGLDGSAINQYGGLWAIDLDTEAVRLVAKLSYGTYAGRVTVIAPQFSTIAGIPPFPPFSTQTMVIGWDSGASTYGIDAYGTTPYTGSQATIDTDLIPIGTFDRPKDFSRIEFKLTRPLVANESITVKYRLIFNTADTGYTTILTDSTTGDYSLSGPINFKNAQWVQFQIVLNSTASSPSLVRLKEIRIR